MVNGAVGRLRFKPSVGSGPALYGGYSTLAYTFGSAAMDVNAVCKVTNTGYTT